MEESYLSLEALAAIIALPQKYLRDLAQRGQIPFLDVNGRKRFCESHVRYALAELANNTSGLQKTFNTSKFHQEVITIAT